ncbi:MAG: hypothetical protein RMJ88_14025 [Thermogemmata sp.]|nr:hypothetical protein [Thermogemmata sp.]
MNLFVLVSTGQRVANLPPVLELAQPGDKALWIESEEARVRNWTDKPKTLLERAGLRTISVVSVAHVNDPALLTTALAPVVDSLVDRFDSTYLVTNGGTKHTPIGLLAAFHRLSPMLLYGEEKPVVYCVYPKEFTTPATIQTYSRHHLDLADILYLNGYTFAKGSCHQQIWPNKLPPTIQDERYGLDEEYTYQLHAQHFVWKSVSTKGERVSFEHLSSLIPHEYQRWIRSVQQVRMVMNWQNLCNLYNSTLNLANSGKRAASKRESGVAVPTARIGDALERAVARRVREWQEVHSHPAIQSIWAGVRIARETTPEIVVAEFDILIVMKNGILVHLECKSASADGRELDVNIHRLQQAGSHLARSAVVVPFFTRCCHEPWFVALHKVRTQVEEQLGKHGFLPFTWPQQPCQYSIPGEEPREIRECTSFEESLMSLLCPYRKDSNNQIGRP